MFVFRLVFWFPLVMAAIPANPADLGARNYNFADGRDISALRMAVFDLVAICDRRPAWCSDTWSLAWRWKMGGANQSLDGIGLREAE